MNKEQLQQFRDYANELTYSFDNYPKGKIIEMLVEKLEKINNPLVCDVCGSTDVIEVPHMGRNCNHCHPLK